MEEVLLLGAAAVLGLHLVQKGGKKPKKKKVESPFSKEQEQKDIATVKKWLLGQTRK